MRSGGGIGGGIINRDVINMNDVKRTNENFNLLMTGTASIK